MGHPILTFRRQSVQSWGVGGVISCFFAVLPVGLCLSFNVRISLMKVKVVCASSVSLGCRFFHQQGEKVEFSFYNPPPPQKKRNFVFGKSTLVSFNEVSEGPGGFSTSGLCLFGAELKIQTFFRTESLPVLVIHHLCCVFMFRPHPEANSFMKVSPHSSVITGTN